MALLWRSKPRKRFLTAKEWIIDEFSRRGLSPPHCTPEALACALEQERHITIEFRSHASDDPGVYGLLYRHEGSERIYIILLRPTYSIALRRLIMFHELAHILYDHALTEVAGVGALRGYMVSDADDAIAEDFAVGAMQYSFMDPEDSLHRTGADDTSSASVLGRMLKRIE